jgi:hypothetical protein
MDGSASGVGGGTTAVPKLIDERSGGLQPLRIGDHEVTPLAPVQLPLVMAVKNPPST